MMMMRTTSTTSITTSALHFRTCDTQSASASATATATSLLLPSFKPNNSKKKKKSNFVLLHQRSSRSSSSTRVGGRGGGGGAVTRASMSSSSLAEGGGAGGVLQKGIAEFYDESSGIWENIWGDHMHHGFYDPDAQASISDHRSAQIRMIEQSLSFAGLNNNNNEESLKIPRSIVDVGCGIGGSSRYLARKYGAKCQGITLSPIQAQRAQELANAQGLGENFVNELIRVASPGGTIIIVTWCHRDLSPPEDSLQPQEKELLKKICDAYYLPAWCSTADYVKLLQSLKMEDIKFADWSEYVAPFWPAVVRSALTWKGLTSLLRSGWKTIKGALAMPLMIEGYKKNLIKFSIITCRKPE
ncbi:hypothetical protein AQUCO_01500448v1 [Aquilegia coerulea]|uniref:Methyltransferase type 11 domain-containing protein n=1 Tax=Aquilegia coerulea TaxID=218851 RepID=A0A2G5DTV8_AQUCA|nr:hypothetical protein AQUCO_01500448v1 [Aquilegia coerulea]PIA46925.1 hypothetical protein AQUCO_01500448v1 [Aquilegia coerulea]